MDIAAVAIIDLGMGGGEPRVMAEISPNRTSIRKM